LARAGRQIAVRHAPGDLGQRARGARGQLAANVETTIAAASASAVAKDSVLYSAARATSTSVRWSATRANASDLVRARKTARDDRRVPIDDRRVAGRHQTARARRALRGARESSRFVMLLHCPSTMPSLRRQRDVGVGTLPEIAAKACQRAWSSQARMTLCAQRDQLRAPRSARTHAIRQLALERSLEYA